MSRRHAAALLVAGLLGAAVVHARPIRTNTPGTGVFIGSGVLGQVVCESQSRGDTRLEGCEFIADFRFTPATHWVLGARAPLYVRREAEFGGRNVSRSGLGDLSISGKYRFFRQVGPWFDRHAAVELGIKLPTGKSTELDLAIPSPVAHRLSPGTGSTDIFVDLVYQQGQGRFVWGGDLFYRRNGTGEGDYRFGEQFRVTFDVEYIAFPRKYTKPGKEVFVLLEGTVIHKADDEMAGLKLPTGGSQVLLAPGIQYIATEQMLVSLSLQFPVLSDVSVEGFETEWNLLAEIRFAF